MPFKEANDDGAAVGVCCTVADRVLGKHGHLIAPTVGCRHRDDAQRARRGRRARRAHRGNRRARRLWCAQCRSRAPMSSRRLLSPRCPLLAAPLNTLIAALAVTDFPTTTTASGTPAGKSQDRLRRRRHRDRSAHSHPPSQERAADAPADPRVCRPTPTITVAIAAEARRNRGIPRLHKETRANRQPRSRQETASATYPRPPTSGPQRPRGGPQPSARPPALDEVVGRGGDSAYSLARQQTRCDGSRCGRLSMSLMRSVTSSFRFQASWPAGLSHQKYDDQPECGAAIAVISRLFCMSCESRGPPPSECNSASMPMHQPTTLTFSAWGPFWPCVMSNSTFCPSSMLR